MGLVAVWAADGKMQTLTMNMVQWVLNLSRIFCIHSIFSLCKSHMGNYLAGCFYKSLQDFGVVDKLLSVPGDNTSSNTTMLQSLKAPGHLPQAHITGTQTQVRCAEHIFDLCNKVYYFFFPMASCNMVLLRLSSACFWQTSAAAVMTMTTNLMKKNVSSPKNLPMMNEKSKKRQPLKISWRPLRTLLNWRRRMGRWEEML